MSQVIFQPDNITIHVEPGTTILEAARRAGVKMESPCNGAGTCGKCKIYVEQINPMEAVLVKKGRGSDQGRAYVLACTACINSDAAITSCSGQQNKSLKILSQGESFKVEIRSFITKKFVRSSGHTEVYADDILIALEEGNQEDSNFGIVVDIGTTTLVASLINLNTGAELNTASAMNPQAIHAQDVLSRIKLASDAKGLEVLHSELIEEINRLLDELITNTLINKKSIYEIILSGNTCMLHLAAGINPHSLGKYPYIPAVTGGNHIKASDFGIGIAEKGIAYLPPIISAYVGADITSGVLASQLYRQSGVVLFIDIGTNGEMVICRDGRLTAASTAAGPAFEGMNITYGMRAGKGAIERFNIEENCRLKLQTIGGTEAVGICGSGLLDLVGELVTNGVIKKNGKFANPGDEKIKPELSERLIQLEGKPVFQVTEKVFLSQNDVRQVQLAKGAVRAGMEFLMDSVGVVAEEVERVLIAGSFGYHLRAKSLINIGLLPAQFDGKIEFIGNTSKSGGQAFLLNKEYRREMKKLAMNIEVIELANYKNFDRVFVGCLGF